MRIRRFQAESINGYMDFDISFLDDLTFLTGINGTGKTSILNAMAGLLMPRLDYLCTQDFDSITLHIEEYGESVTLSAQKDPNLDLTYLYCSKFPEETVTIQPYDDSDDFPSFKAEENEERYYKKQYSINSKNDILKFILDLPTPMFLGLDRKFQSSDGEQYEYNLRYRRAGSRRKRNIFGGSLNGGLNQALYFAEKTIKSKFIQKSSLDKKFRDNLIFELLNFPARDFEGLMKDNELINPKKLDDAKQNIFKIPQLLSISNDDISPKLEEFFNYIQGKIDALQEVDPDGTEVDPPSPLEDENFEQRFALGYNKPNIDKINALSKMVSEYTDELDSIFLEVDEFLKLINSFVKDSGKTLSYNETGSLIYRVGKELNERDLRTLSSGEIQLLVIFAHLYFNSETEKANVFIIDEPELSLHVQWQAKFVDALISVTADTQFIMATHSPTVIIDRVKHCKEITNS